MPVSFTVYVDESGDEGFVFLPDEKGSSRWLVLSAAVFRKESRYFNLLAPTCYRRQKAVTGYGLKFWPEDVESLSEELPHLAIFHSGK